MAAIAQIVDGHGGPLVCELNGWTSGVGGLLQKGVIAAEGQTSAIRDESNWSPVNGPAGLGRRRITVPFLLIGSSADDLGVKVAKLMQATQSPWWLRLRRHNATADNYLQCFPTVPQVQTDITGSSTSHMAEGVIVAETAPYALGARVDSTAVAVGQNPASGTAWGLDINGVGGDSATPLLLRLQDTNAFSSAMGAWISVRRRQTPANLTSTALFRNGEDPVNGYNSGTDVTLATFSDNTMASGQCARATFGAAYLSPAGASISVTSPSLTGPDVPGTYRVFVRMRRNNNAHPYTFKPSFNSSVITPEDITVPAGGADIRTVDLGLIQWPSGQPSHIASPIADPSGATTTRILLQFWKRLDGAGILDIDYVAFIPADEDGGFLTTDQALPTASSQYVVIDGYQHLAMVTNADPIGPHSILGQNPNTSLPTAEWTGGAPRVGPGNNRLFVVAGTGGITAWPLVRPLSVAYSYWPRFTWLR